MNDNVEYTSHLEIKVNMVVCNINTKQENTMQALSCLC